MDLTTTHPRSPKERLAGLDSLARTIDKAKAHNAGTLGDYDYDCPHDKPLFEFLGTDGATFARKVGELETDAAIVDWLSRESLSKKTPADFDRFNAERERWHPDPGSHSEHFFHSERERLGRPDLETWFDLLDVDEGRPVPEPMKV